VQKALALPLKQNSISTNKNARTSPTIHPGISLDNLRNHPRFKNERSRKLAKLLAYRFRIGISIILRRLDKQHQLLPFRPFRINHNDTPRPRVLLHESIRRRRRKTPDGLRHRPPLPNLRPPNLPANLPNLHAIPSRRNLQHNLQLFHNSQKQRKILQRIQKNLKEQKEHPHRINYPFHNLISRRILPKHRIPLRNNLHNTFSLDLHKIPRQMHDCPNLPRQTHRRRLARRRSSHRQNNDQKISPRSFLQGNSTPEKT